MENPTYPPACGRAQEVALPGHPAAAAGPDCATDPEAAALMAGEAAASAAARGANARGAKPAAPVRIPGWEERDPVRALPHEPRSGAGAPEPNRRPSADRAASDRGLGRGTGRDLNQGRDQSPGLLDLPTLERRRNHDANGETVHFALEYCLHVPRRSAPACAENNAATMPILIPLTAYPFTAYP